MTINSQMFAPREVKQIGSTALSVNANNTGVDEIPFIANIQRARLIVSNLSAANPLYLNFGAAAGPGAGLVIPALGYWDSGNGAVPTDPIHVLGTAGQPRCIIEM